jgi:uncharacterized repeat protein (TIGR01451 family)
MTGRSRDHVGGKRRSVAWRIVAVTGVILGATFSVSALTSAASAATFGPDKFMDIGGTIQKDAVTAAAGWSNSGTRTTGAPCTNGGVHIAGSTGLFDCGAAVGSSATPFPVTNQNPTFNTALGNANGVFQSAFIIDQTDASHTTCPGGVQVGSNQFGGGEKFTDDPSSDSYSLGSVQAKDQISNVYAVARQNSAGDDEVYVGLERLVNNGDTHADFQFLQEPVAETTACSGNFSGGVHEQGDVVLEINFDNGGANPSSDVLVWSCTGTLSGTQAPVGTACRGTNSTAPYKNATWVVDPVGASAVTIATNASASVPCGAWVCRDTSGNSVATLASNEFMEGAVNLDGLGINLGCAATFFPLTRSAGSGVTSQIESFAPPTKFQTCANTTTTTNPTSPTVSLGSSNTDSATVTRAFGNVTPTGSVAFYACGPFATAPTTDPVCTPTSGNATSLGSVSTATSTTSTSATFTSPAFTAGSAGFYCFDAEYTPTSGNKLEPSNDYTTQAETECFQVTPLTPTLATTIAAPQDTSLGNSWGDSATVTGQSPYGAPAGTVSWTLCEETSVNTPCSGGKALGSTSTFTTNGVVSTYTLPTADNAVPAGVGDWCFNTAFTSTSANYASVPSGHSECFTVTQAASGTKTKVTPTSLTLSASGTITDTVTVSGSAKAGVAPTGTVDFYVCKASTCDPTALSPEDANVSLSASGATTASASSSAFTPTSPGTWCFAAVYSGDTNYLGSQDNTSAANADTAECATVGKAGSSIGTTVYDVNTGQPWSGTETAPADAHDTAGVTGISGFTPSGTVTYAYFTNGTCSGTASTTQTVTLSGGNVPNSADTGALSKGDYSYLATYSGDGNYAGSIATCEPFSVGKAPSHTATVVNDAATSKAWDTTEVTGASAYDTATVTGGDGAATGTVTYNLFATGNCAGSPVSTETVTLSGGNVPDSSATGPLAAGSYSYSDLYSGDPNYSASAGTCEPFSVGKGASTTKTVVNDAATNDTWSGSEVTGASAYDTATVTGFDGIDPTGGVTYTFFDSADCSAGSVFTDPVTLSSGTVPDSNSTSPLGGGAYSFQAVYAGDANYKGSTGSCEPFTVLPADSGTSTTVFDANSGSPWAGTETVGASAFDTSSVTGVTGFAPTGSVTYTLFTNGTCAGDGTGQEVTVGDGGSVPNSDATAPLGAGSYSYLDNYSGDSNYNSSTGTCEPFSVGKATPTLTTVVDDPSTNAAWDNSETAGATAFDTSTLTAVPGFVPTGTVTYLLFNNDSCTPDGTNAGSPALSAGNVPNSDTSAPLAAGSYSYLATYSGDGNYAGVAATCEPFSVAQATTQTATVVFDASTQKPWAGTETTGATAFDTSTVTGAPSPFEPTGTVTYSFFHNGTCSGDAPATTEQVSLSGGTVPPSGITSALTAGSYSYMAVYSGDANNLASGGLAPDCEPFTVALTPAVVSATKSSDPADGSVVARGAHITYTVTLENSGEADATGLTVTDSVPTGTTFVSAANGGTLANGVVTWTGVDVAGNNGTTSVSFVVSVDATDTNNQVIPNTAGFTDVNTPNCKGAATCDTNTVKVTVHVAQTAPQTATTVAATTTTAKKGGLAFTGANVFRTIGGGMLLTLVGSLLVVAGRRRRSA